MENNHSTQKKVKLKNISTSREDCSYAKEQQDKQHQLLIFINNNWDIYYNEITERIDLKDKNNGSSYRPIEDYDVNTIFFRILAAGIKIAPEYLKQFLKSDKINRVNPIKQKIEKYHKKYYQKSSVEEPNTIDAINELANTVITNNSKHWEIYFKKWIVGLVANVYITDRCANHLCLTLSGEQGKFKSTFLSKILPDDLLSYRYIGKIYPNSKDSLSLFATKLLVIIDDQLHQINKNDANDIKEILTKDMITWRMPYATYDITKPHLATAAATVNGLEFLNDLTGSRRFLAIEIISIDINAANEIDKELIFAQAYDLYLSGYKYWLDDKENKELSEENEKFHLATPEYEFLLKHYEIDNSRSKANFITTTDICHSIQATTPIKISTKKIGEALKKLGIDKAPARIDGKNNPVWGYYLIEKLDKKIQINDEKTEEKLF